MSKKTKLSVESYKGVRDFYPEDQAFLNYLFSTCRGVAERYGYVEYHASVLEPSELYRSKGAENEEMVNEQTYTFTDRGGREVTLRPEMTPTVARMVAAKRRELGFPLRFFSIPNLFRYERPQRGRVREHWQLNVDLFGSQSPHADAEVISLAHALMFAFGAKSDDFSIKLGSRKEIDQIASKHKLHEREKNNFIALLDRKGKMSPEEFQTKLADFRIPPDELLGEQIPADVAMILEALKSQGILNVSFDPSIVRGFNYYTGIVFEVFDSHPENTRSLFGGGRYDNLTALFDDESISGVGFGMGDATIENFLSVRGLLPAYTPPTRVYIALTSEERFVYAQQVAQQLRTGGITVAIDFGEKKIADQIKTAAKHKIPYLIVIGTDEERSGNLKIKALDTGEELELPQSKLVSHFSAI